MKSTVKLIVLMISLAGIGVACNSTKQNPGPEIGGGARVLISEPVAERTTDFAFDFFQKLVPSQSASDNIFVSPLSLHMALGMLVNGTEGTTADEIKKVLKMDGVSQEELNEAYQTLSEKLPLADPKVKLAIANSVWHRKDLRVESGFIQEMKKTFQAQVSPEDFSDPATVSKINTWASDHTNGKIKKVLEKINADDAMFLLNALYFKGDWKYKFDEKKTQNAPFALTDGSKKLVRMMELSADLGVFSNKEYVSVQLPYANGQYNLTLVIPVEGDVNELVKQFDKSDWDQLQTHFQNGTKPAIVKLPKFTLDYEIKLNETLKAMGMSKVFNESAELGKISRVEDLMVSFIKQNTFLGVDEKGTEAAAVTTIGIVLTSMPTRQTVVFDKPFLFFISEKSSNTIQFMGRITNP